MVITPQLACSQATMPIVSKPNAPPEHQRKASAEPSARFSSDTLGQDYTPLQYLETENSKAEHG